MINTEGMTEDQIYRAYAKMFFKSCFMWVLNLFDYIFIFNFMIQGRHDPRLTNYINMFIKDIEKYGVKNVKFGHCRMAIESKQFIVKFWDANRYYAWFTHNEVYDKVKNENIKFLEHKRPNRLALIKMRRIRKAVIKDVKDNVYGDNTKWELYQNE